MTDDLGLTPRELALLQSSTVSSDAARDSEASIETDASWPRSVCLRRQLEVLESYHQDVASRFSDALSRSLQRLVEVRLMGVESLTYSQFVTSRQDPTCFVVLQAQPLPTSLVLDIAPSLLYPLLDCMLGGGQQPCEIPNRPTTELEQRLVRGIVRTLLDELHDAWEPLLAIDLSIERIECHAQRVRVVAPVDAVASLTFQFTVAHQVGEMTLCLPSRTIGKMIDKLLVADYPVGDDLATSDVAEPCDDSARQGDSQTSRSHTANREDQDGPTSSGQPIVVQFTAEAISSAELRNLRAGDVILSDLTIDAPVDLVQDNQPVGQGMLGAIRGHRAVQVIDET